MSEEEWLKEIPELYRVVEGTNKLKITDRITVVTNRWGRKTFRIPTDKGVFLTGSPAIARAIKQFMLEHGDYVGATMSFEVVGEGNQRRYLKIKLTKK